MSTPTHGKWIGQPYATVDLNPMPEPTLSPSQEITIRPQDTAAKCKRTPSLPYRNKYYRLLGTIRYNTKWRISGPNSGLDGKKNVAYENITLGNHGEVNEMSQSILSSQSPKPCHTGVDIDMQSRGLCTYTELTPSPNIFLGPTQNLDWPGGTIAKIMVRSSTVICFNFLLFLIKILKRCSKF
jgi:hypothetical protein